MSIIITLVWRGRPRYSRLWLATLPLIFAAGCRAPAPVVNSLAAEPQPINLISEEKTLSCQEIWASHAAHFELTPQYWLQTMDCALKLTPALARAEASRQPDDTWQGVLRRSILLGNARITPAERKQQRIALDAMDAQVSPDLRRLYRLWRDVQEYNYALSQARTHYDKLQQTSEKQIEELREACRQQHNLLIQTQQKLQTLTDIERQLSNRKSGSLETHGLIKDVSPAGKIIKPHDIEVNEETGP